MARLTRIVQDIYGAFGRGDVPAIAATFADDIRFVHGGGPDLPYAKDRRGKAQAMAFFADLADAVEVTAFEPARYVEEGDAVMVTGRWAGRARRTGKPYAVDWAMLWVFDGDKVKSYQGFEDTNAMAKAFAA